jgi:hypothetical protein
MSLEVQCPLGWCGELVVAVGKGQLWWVAILDPGVEKFDFVG